MLYEDHETEISKNVLSRVLAKVEEPACLLGGWAVYFAVNARYSQEHVKSYIGSKDIDLGFHFSGHEEAESITQSACAKSILALKQLGFTGVSSRLVQAYCRETRRALGLEEAQKVPLHNLFHLYVDPIVDKIPDAFQDMLGFQPIDEPLLAPVFEDGRYDEIDELGAKIMLPKPDVLLATKIVALSQREKDHKRHKDIADIYALLWYSGAALGALRDGVLRYVSAKIVKNALVNVSDEEYAIASDVLDVDTDLLKGVINTFIDSCTDAAAAGTSGKDLGQWKIPYGIGYDAFIKIPKTLFQQNADTRPVSRDKIARIASLSTRVMRLNLDFLKSVGVVVDVAPSSYRLTALGLAMPRHTNHLTNEP